MGSQDQDDGLLQRRSLAAYLALTARSGDWSRQLVLLTASDTAAPFALAALAAGGAALWTAGDTAQLRQSGLAGLTDFQVTTLSEALRILKNEIRKGLPVSVGVLNSNGGVWREAVARGVQPAALLPGTHDAGDAGVLIERGAWPLEPQDEAKLVHIREDRADTWRGRRDGDAALLSAAGLRSEPERTIAERWLRAAGRLFPRDLVRSYASSWAASNHSR